eukprot:5927848-Prymnesium_polylepis.1
MPPCHWCMHRAQLLTPTILSQCCGRPICCRWAKAARSSGARASAACPASPAKYGRRLLS